MRERRNFIMRYDQRWVSIPAMGLMTSGVANGVLAHHRKVCVDRDADGGLEGGKGWGGWGGRVGVE
jgi:hypothetical protein